LTRARGETTWLVVEQLVWAGGVVCFATWVVFRISGAMEARQELERFAALSTAARPPDPGLWSPGRAAVPQTKPGEDARLPLGVLRIPRIGVTVPMLEGTDEWTLNRAVGHIEDTALPDTGGNIGIAGHRDGLFRPLKDIRVADVLELETLSGVATYRVETTGIVNPEDVWVLDPTPTETVTLVTCYPFFFVGAAPQRFIVQASRISSGDGR